MRELPPAPAGRAGWPWTLEAVARGDDGEPGDGLPRISIVTPSYNQADYLEATIRSVLLQGYPNLEYRVLDGGSSDGSVEIMRKYERWLTSWESGPDRGQADAINRGLRACDGTVFNWINSDDQLLPGALREVGAVWSRERPHLLVGRGLVVAHGDGRVIHDWAPRPPRSPGDFLRDHGVVMSQPSTFIDRELLVGLGGVREDLHYVLDWELYLRIAIARRGALRTATTEVCLSRALSHPEAKTVRDSSRFGEEAEAVVSEAWGRWTARERVRARGWLRRLRSQRLLAEIPLDGSEAMARLARLPVGAPSLLWSRPYWGAVRRAALRTSRRERAE